MEPTSNENSINYLNSKKKIKSRITEELFPEFSSDEEFENEPKHQVYKLPEFKGKMYITNSRLAEASRALNISEDESSEKRDKRRDWVHPRPRRESSYKMLVPISQLFTDSFQHLLKRPSIKVKEDYIKKNYLRLSSNKVLSLMYDIERRKHNETKKCNKLNHIVIEDNADD